MVPSGPRLMCPMKLPSSRWTLSFLPRKDFSLYTRISTLIFQFSSLLCLLFMLMSWSPMASLCLFFSNHWRWRRHMILPPIPFHRHRNLHLPKKTSVYFEEFVVHHWEGTKGFQREFFRSIWTFLGQYTRELKEESQECREWIAGDIQLQHLPGQA